MRQLSKVIFINSAGIRYGEVRLDGNVHLIGTQGVGKSTILRAILFFYTAEKSKLGISREKKSFDEFYLPGADSYLIYQVESEFGAFCVLVFRHHAHAAFRFIGAPYRQEWFIGEDGSVMADSSQIRRRLGPVTLTRIIDQYQEYRDILYGNHTATEKEFSRYALTETPKYQNIPRSLQNVFLGAKVDADFIKDIIIRSLGDEEPGIDLIYFRGQLAEFDREYNDIRQWFRKEKSGEVKVRVQAQKLIDQYRQLLYLDDELETGLLELRYAQRAAGERIPLTEKQAEETEIQLQKHKERLEELEDKYKKELSSLDEELGIVKDALEKIPKLRKQYEALGIQALLEEDGREPALKAQLVSQEQLRTRLTQQYTDISAKYQDRETTLKLGFESWKAAREQRKVEIGEALNVQVANVLAATREETDRIHASFAQREEAASAQVEDLKERIAVIDKQLALTAHLSPYARELASARSELARLQSEDRALAASEKTASSAVESAIREGQLIEASLNREWEEKLKTVSSQLTEKANQINQIQELLVSLDNTLVQWLSKNKPDWCSNIGKVAGENILYATKLYPSLTKGDSLYGIDLDLSGIKTTVRTPEQLLSQKQRLEKERQALEAQLDALTADKETALQSHRKKVNAKVKALREELSRIQTARLMLPSKIETCQKQMALYEEKNLQERTEAETKLKDQLSALTRDRVLAEEAKKALRAEKEESLRKVRENETQHRKSLLQQRDEALSAIAKEIAAQAAKLQESLNQLALERQQELSGKGADTKALSLCETAIRELTQRLDTITQNKETLFRYRSDKENYFDRKDHFLSRKKSIEEKKEGLQERFKLKRRKEEDALNTQNETLLSLKQQLHTLREGLQDAQNFQKSNVLPLLPDGREKETDKSCRQLIDDIHRCLYQMQNTESEFHQSISAFTDLFSPGNVFGFKTDCRTSEDYRAFAASLAEFMDNDKIEEFRRRTSEHYTDLLLRISHEMDEVSRNASEIAGIIRDINFDFREKNFIGAVKSIELRTIPSADKMVHLMSQIKQFNDEHGFEMGEVNLFAGDTREQVHTQAVTYLQELTEHLSGEFAGRTRLTLGDTFQLQFRIQENDNDTGWVEKISSVGSDGTDVLVKAMVNIMLINVFKERVSGRFTDFRIHCVMDEIGKLHPRNIKGILDFAGARNIFLVNGSPVPYNVSDYKHTYLLTKESGHTVIRALLSRKEAAENENQ